MYILQLLYFIDKHRTKNYDVHMNTYHKEYYCNNK